MKMNKSFEKVKRERNEEEVEFLKLKKVFEELEEPLRELSLKLAEIGLPVKDNLRIDISAFSEDENFKKEVKNDIDFSFLKKEEFSKEKKEYRGLIGEVAEMLKTLYFNNHLFADNFYILRTSEFDDYTNHIDEVIIKPDPEKPKILAALDVTSSREAYLKKVRRFRKLYQEEKKCFSLKYGFLAYKNQEKLEIEKSSFSRIPFVVLLLPGNIREIENWHNLLKEKKYEELDKLFYGSLELLLIHQLRNISDDQKDDYNWFKEVVEEKLSQIKV